MSKVFIVRFHVIQFTRYSVACRSRGELVNISTSNLICQALFSSFLNFFEEACRLIFDLLVARRQLCYAITLSFVCQELFSSFSNFFRKFQLFVSPEANFAMLAHPTPFVKYFFQSFSNFITGCSVSAVPCGQLAYTSTSFTVCQELFSSFFNFLRCVCIFYAALADSFDILSDLSPFVKRFFQNSSN